MTAAATEVKTGGTNHIAETDPTMMSLRIMTRMDTRMKAGTPLVFILMFSVTLESRVYVHDNVIILELALDGRCMNSCLHSCPDILECSTCAAACIRHD